MDSRTNTVFNILKTTLSLFREKGFEATSIREIAQTADVSLGMVNHYFGNKEFLGTQCLLILNSYAIAGLTDIVTIEEDPILFDLTSIRVLYLYLNRHGYEQFYRDSLSNDFFFKYLSDKPLILVKMLSRIYPISTSEEEALLYSRYLPYMMEKTLILKKAEGLFPSIDPERIPLMICSTALNHFIPEQNVIAKDPESIRLAHILVDPLEPTVPDAFLSDFVAQYIKKLDETNASQKNSWIRKMNKA